MALYANDVYVYRGNLKVYYGEVEYVSEPKQYEVNEVYIRALNRRFRVIVCSAVWICIVEDL